MRILTCPGQLQRLEDALRRSLPASLPVLGAVMTVARGNPAAHQVLVDSWPDFTVVLTLSPPCPQELADPGDFYANQLTAFYREEGAWRAVLGNPEAVDWSRAFQMQGERGGEPCAEPPAPGTRLTGLSPGMQDGVHEAVNEVAAAKGLRGPWAQPQIPAGLRLAPLSPSHVPLLNATWSFGGTGRSRRFLEGLVRALPSACILDPRGRPLSWSLVDPLGCLSHGYTVPAWRGRGLSGLVLAALGRELHARGFPLYCGVLPCNAPSLRALHAAGFLPQPGTFYMLLSTPK
uniref:Glycine N-acyltransferase-like protein n=1 Tax=Anas platyrhynchos platyrhynchos TaxID=8840 RepID=A0A493TB52_ANAPP